MARRQRCGEVEAGGAPPGRDAVKLTGPDAVELVVFGVGVLVVGVLAVVALWQLLAVIVGAG